MAFLMCTFAEDPYRECKLQKKKEEKTYQIYMRLFRDYLTLVVPGVGTSKCNSSVRRKMWIYENSESEDL